MGRDASIKASALRAFTAIADRWQLSEQERRRWLGLDSPEEFSIRSGPLYPELLDDRAVIRISLALGIYAALHTLFDEHFADLWISRPNTRFGGQSARDIVAENPEKLSEIRRYLEGELTI